MILRIFLRRLDENRDKLTRHEFKTIRGQALAGDIDGAARGLSRLIGGGVVAKKAVTSVQAPRMS